MIYRIDVRITAPVRNTEVADRVADAILELFPDATVRTEPDEVIAESHSLERLSERLHEQAILDTARGVFFDGHSGDSFAFDLKKTAAFQGVVNFSVGEPDELGDLHVHVRVEEPTVPEFVDHVAPPTEDGRPVSG